MTLQLQRLIAAAQAVHDEHWDQDGSVGEQWNHFQKRPWAEAYPKYQELHDALAALSQPSAQGTGSDILQYVKLHPEPAAEALKTALAQIEALQSEVTVGKAFMQSSLRYEAERDAALARAEKAEKVLHCHNCGATEPKSDPDSPSGAGWWTRVACCASCLFALRDQGHEGEKP